MSTGDIRATEQSLLEVRRALQAVREKLPRQRWEPIKRYTRLPSSRHYLDATPDFALAGTWASGLPYAAGAVVEPTTANGRLYECTTAGTSGGTEPSWATTVGTPTVDNAAVWRCRGAHVIECGEDVPLFSPIKYEYGGTSYYGIVWARSMDDDTLAFSRHLAVAGAPMYLDDDITGLWYGLPEMVVQIPLWVEGAYAASGIQDVLDKIADMNFVWRLPQAYLVTFSMMHKVLGADTTLHMNVNHYDTTWGSVSREANSSGIVPTVATPGGTDWADNPFGTIAIAEYGFAPGDWLELECTETSATAEDLSVMLTFVLE